jgi:Zn finger protein HypA/HybF involved in hydrogenase expression
VAGILDRTRRGLDRIDLKTDKSIFPVEVRCARCNRNLMDSTQEVDGHPAIRVTISFGELHGALLLSCLYGSYTIRSEHEVPESAVADFFCPHCHAHMTGAGGCYECGAPMVPMLVRGGGIVQICSRRGCRAHTLDLSGVND